MLLVGHSPRKLLFMKSCAVNITSARLTSPMQQLIQQLDWFELWAGKLDLRT